jgi:CheY-like chemotaxis protein
VKAPCEALVLEDDPRQLEVVTAALRDVHMEPLPALSPQQALNKLRYFRPVLAVVDLDMSLAPESKSTVDDVLLRLYEDFGGCFVLVYSVKADDIIDRKRVEDLHPLALFVSKQDGVGKLVSRIHRMMGMRFGDLHVHQGMTFHVPSGEAYPHRVGVSLILGATLQQEVVLNATEAKAARRLGDWLRRVASNVTIVDHGRRRYALSLAEASSGDGTSPASG